MLEVGIDDPGSTEAKIKLEVLRERQRHFEDRVCYLEQKLVQTCTYLEIKEKELERLREERENLKLKWEVLKKDHQYIQDSFLQNKKRTTQKKRFIKFQAFCTSLVFLLSSILVNIGTGMFTSTPSNPALGWFIMVLAVALYLIATFLTTVFALESEN